MDLLRLPLLVLKEVFKNMDFREKFLISLMSKRARNTLKLTCEKPYFSFELSNDFSIFLEPSDRDRALTDEKQYLILGESLKLRFYPNGMKLNSQSIREQLFLAGYLLDTFTNPTSSVCFQYPTEPVDVWKFMKMINQRQGSIKSFQYRFEGESSEFASRILDECTEVTDYIWIHRVFSGDFVYTPPRPFKAKKLNFGETSNLFNVEKFMSCRNIYLKRKENSIWPTQTYNSFIQKWMDLSVPLQELSFGTMQESEEYLIMDVLRNLGVMKKIKSEWFELKRRDGSKFFINNNCHILITIYTKQAYLEKVKDDEEELVRPFGDLWA
uniref:F-box domain-containing protein n=2 Tax=Caenorhabditis tropicalis TaxID=1561998 RepID=A0A1I7UTN8_9PELO